MKHAHGFVGVDVVDLRDPRCEGKTDDARFLARVLADGERDAVAAATDAASVLWRLWAAKEAAFKVVSKLRGAPPPFAHAAFRVDPAGTRSGDGFGHVVWEDVTVRVHWHEMADRVGAIAWDGPAEDEPIEWGWGAASEIDPAPGEPLETLVLRLSEGERGPVHSRGSALVRLAARAALASALDADEKRIAVVSREGPKGRMPPEALLDGRAAPADVSLSHHGRWIAWAIRLAEPRAR
jgi:phosphopantetheinyl transferase (holo-ACP synthase)